ncbi:MAG: M14 family zinc carboxypeptidase [Flavobacteriaceae bacterium]
MNSKKAIELLKSCKEKTLFHRYVHTDHIRPLLENLGTNFLVSQIGNSVKDEPIFSVTIGNGPKKVLMWSQMHGNESTTTKAIFDVFNILKHDNWFSKVVLNECTLTIIPILNPDGARLYTRFNANEIDLNRDAQIKSQPEIEVLFKVFNEVKPDFCFNLHGQRTIFSAGKTKSPATISFLAPAQDIKTSVTTNRKRAMEVIVAMNRSLQQIIPNQVGIYDDSFNLNCVGDTFQSNNVPTILFEAGHYEKDYKREEVRKYIGLAMMKSLSYIANTDVSGDLHLPYFDIPMNEKLFFDIIIRNAKVNENSKATDIAVQYQEILINNKIHFKPVVNSIGDLSNYFGHVEIDANLKLVMCENREPIFEGYENDFVLLNDELFALNLVNN